MAAIVNYAVPSSDKAVGPKSRRGGEYVVRVDSCDGTVLDCTCADYIYRRRACKHMKTATTHPRARILSPLSVEDQAQIAAAQLVQDAAREKERERTLAAAAVPSVTAAIRGTKDDLWG